MKFVEWTHFAIFISLLLITLTYEETVPRTVKPILSVELKTHAFKNKKQKISEHLSDALNANVLQTVDCAESSTNMQNNQFSNPMPMLMPNQTFAANQTPVNFNSANTMVDANGQQFYLLPVNSVQNQHLQMINAGRETIILVLEADQMKESNVGK